MWSAAAKSPPSTLLNRTSVLFDGGMSLLPEPGPIRTLALATLVNTVGSGLWMVSSALFLTRSIGLSVAQTGLALTLVALVSLVSSTPVGYLADRLGPRGVA